MLCAGQAEAKAFNRARPRTITRIANRPAHGMSAMAREQARQRQLREQNNGVVADEREGVRFGAFKRDYGLNIPRSSIRPDRDGAVGLLLAVQDPRLRPMA